MPLTPEQLEQRRHLLTASDAAAVLGLDPWRSAHDVWAQKMGTAPPFAGNWRTRRGNAMEPLLLEWLGERLAARDRPLALEPRGHETRVHPILSWLGATLDAVIVDPARSEVVGVGEAKSTGAVSHWLDENGNPQVPDYYQVQVIVQMAVARVPRAEVVVEVIGESEPWILPFERSEDDELAVTEGLERFWTDHVLARKPPPLEDATYRQVAKVYPWAKRPHQIGTTPEADALAARYLKAKAIETKAHEAAELAKTELCKIIGDNEGIAAPTWRATWKRREAVELKYTKSAYRHFDLRPVAVREGRR